MGDEPYAIPPKNVPCYLINYSTYSWLTTSLPTPKMSTFCSFSGFWHLATTTTIPWTLTPSTTARFRGSTCLLPASSTTHPRNEHECLFQGSDNPPPASTTFQPKNRAGMLAFRDLPPLWPPLLSPVPWSWAQLLVFGVPPTFCLPPAPHIPEMSMNACFGDLTTHCLPTPLPNPETEQECSRSGMWLLSDQPLLSPEPRNEYKCSFWGSDCLCLLLPPPNPETEHECAWFYF